MLPRLKCPVIALEEHYWDKELAAQFVGGEGVRDPEMLKRLYDLGEVRIKEMDEAGIDMQILSHGAPSAQKLSGADAVDLTRRVNDRLHAVVAGNPKRFAAFAALPLRLLTIPPGSVPARHIYPVRLENRDALREHLSSKGVETSVHYPVPLHLQPAFAFLGKKAGDFPVSEKACTTVVSLPLHASLTNDQVEAVIAAVASFFEGRR